MIELSLGFALAAFIAGILMFLAPCTLPLVPAYLAFISGTQHSKLLDEATKDQARRAVLLNSASYVIGFSAVFIVFGITLGFFGSFLGEFRNTLAHLGGLFIICFGLMMLGVIDIGSLQRERKFRLPAFLTPGMPSSAFIMGAIFALGWTPCVGPILASILLLASFSATVLEGGILLSIFAVGLAIPFLLSAIFYAYAVIFITRFSIVARFISIIGGLFLICIGLLLFTGNFSLTIEYGYGLFDFLHYDSLLDYL